MLLGSGKANKTRLLATAEKVGAQIVHMCVHCYRFYLLDPTTELQFNYIDSAKKTSEYFWGKCMPYYNILPHHLQKNLVTSNDVAYFIKIDTIILLVMPLD